MEAIPAELVQKAKDELNETPERREDAIRVLLNRIQMSSYSANWIEDDPNFLLRFLRVGKFDCDKAFERLNKYFSGKKKYKKLYEERPSELTEAIKNNKLSLFPVRDKDGCRIMYYNIGNWDTSKVTFQASMQGFVTCLEMALGQLETQICGVKVIIDCSGFGIQHIFYLKPNIMIATLHILQSITPARLKGIHVVNDPAIFQLPYRIIRPFTSKKFRERLVFHGCDLTVLHEKINVECLPEELGGQLPSKNDLTEDFIKDVLEWEPTWEKHNSYQFETNV